MTKPVVPYFQLLGTIDRDTVSATWSDDCLTADPELWDRAELLVEMGETFTAEGVELEVHAGLTVPYAAALTLIRCFDRISKAEIMLGSEQQDNDARVTIELVHVASPTKSEPGIDMPPV